MADDYIAAPIETDPEVLERIAYDYIQSKFPAWVPNDGNLETWQIMALASMLAEANVVAADVPPQIFKYFGTKLVGLAPIPATFATVTATWNLSSPAASDVVIDAGTTVSLPGADGDTKYFELVTDETIPTGSSSVVGTTLRAIEEGPEYNNLGGVGFSAGIVDFVGDLDTIILAGPTLGGAAEESDDDYLDRLSRRLTLLTARPILASDHALLARDLAEQQGYEVRALAVDLYNPADGTTDNERMVTVTMVDAATAANVPPTLLTFVDDELQATREINFIINVVNPDRTPIDVEFAVVLYPGADPVGTLADAVAAVTDYFVNWGQPANQENVAWISRPVVRHQDISTVINNVRGVDYWTSLNMRIAPAAFAAADINLSGGSPIALAVAGTVSGAVV